MNRLFAILCMASLLVFHTSCDDSVMDLESPNMEMETRAADQKVQNLILQARFGDVEAYNSLALCYRDGDGVEKSWLNMICMYAIYCQKTGGDIEDIKEFFDEGHPFRLLFEIVDSSSLDEIAETKLEQLKLLVPAEAKAIAAAKKLFSKEDAVAAMCLMREAEVEGSETAVVFQALYYDKIKDKIRQEECLIRISERYPFFYLLLGDMYIEKYENTDDSSYIHAAIECYYKADERGMLIPRHASSLLGMYYYYGQNGLLEYDEQEVERLRVLAKRTYKTK